MYGLLVPQASSAQPHASLLPATRALPAPTEVYLRAARDPPLRSHLGWRRTLPAYKRVRR
jgi:hypothetical protein